MAYVFAARGLAINVMYTTDDPKKRAARPGARSWLIWHMAPGPVFFHNNNDLREGFRRSTEVPEYIYVLGFSPQKLDGKFHKLKVKVSSEKVTVQARPGYYALKQASGS
jgi:hypothetical protein